MQPANVHVRNLFLRLLGLVYLTAFLSLHAQLSLLIGSRGLLPAASHLTAIGRVGTFLGAPTIFWLDPSDLALNAAAIAGELLSVVLVVGFAPRICLVGLWVIYLSFATVGQDFFSFQWDNLLLETGLFSILVAPGGLRLSSAPPPHPVGIFLLRWLLLRLNVESGLAKLLTGDPTWRDLTAMASYYETAPLPTWVGWYAHQMPLWAHRVSSFATLLIELAVAPLVFAPRRIRLVVFVVLNAMQLGILLTANYGFFNYLTLLLSLLLLDDGDLTALRFSTDRLVRHPTNARPALGPALLAAVVVPLSLVPFLPFFGPLGGINRELAPVRHLLASFRSLNAYHLFAQMTLERDEIVIEGSDDGLSWSSYEFRYKPGDPGRAPGFVAPHQPRVDFQLWFLLLGGPPRAPYFDELLRRLLTDPASVASLFARDPFPDVPPRMLRVAFYRYRFTDRATRRGTGEWWARELLSVSRPIRAESFQR
jgi:hypothetical protein